MNNRVFIVVTAMIIALMVLAGGFASGYLVGRHRSGSNTFSMPRLSSETVRATPSLDLVQEVINMVKHTYVSKVSNEELVIGAVRGVLKALNDPYSHYFSPSDYNYFQEETAGRFYGVGIELGMTDSQLTVASTIEGTPAQRAGIKSGDIITKIDDKSTKGMAIHKAVTLIRGDENTKVVLTIEREGEKKPLEFDLIRAEIKLPNVKKRMLDDRTGYVRLHTFSEGCGEDIRKAVEDLKSQGARGIIFDLRSNPGGLLSEAVRVSSVFVDSGVIVSIKKRSGSKEEYRAEGGADKSIALVILVDQGSASASEIVAGAVKDHKRGVLVGEKTFGKGSVQTMMELSNGGGMVITTAVYMTPNGTIIHKKGIKPDVVSKTPKEITEKNDPQLNRAKEILNDIIDGREWKQKAA